MKLIDQLNQMPPPIVRLLCPLTEREIVKASGLSLATVRRISAQPDWSKQLRIMSAFLDATGITVRVTIPALRRVKRIMGSKKGLDGVRHLKAHSQKTKAIQRIVRVMK